MSRILNIGWFFLCCWLASASVRAQSPFRFEQARIIDRSNGLPVNSVRAICKDPEGFVWIGTSEGLCRFDGSRMKVYRNNPNDSTSLFDNEVNDVTAFQGRIWVATNMGVSVLDPRTEQFVHYQFDSAGAVDKPIRAPRRQAIVLHVDKWGNLWVGTYLSGAVRYRPERNDFRFYRLLQPKAMSQAEHMEGALRILNITEDLQNDSILYAGTPSGLQVINIYSGTVEWRVFQRKDPAEQRAVNAFRRLYFHDDGMLYVGSWHGGIQVYDPRRQTLTPLPTRDPRMAEFLKSGIQSIIRHNRDRIWITLGIGLVLYDLRTGKILYLRKNDLSEGKYYGIDFIDEYHRIWYGNINGIQVFDPVMEQFVSFPYRTKAQPGWSFALYVAADTLSHELIVPPLNDNCVYHFDLRTESWRRFDFRSIGAKNSPENWLIRGMARAPDGTYTLSADHGLYAYDPSRHTVRPLPIRLPFRDKRYGNVLWDRKGQLWLGVGLNGLVRWTPHTNALRIFNRELLSPDADQKALVSGGMKEDRRGQLWLRRNDGFSVYLPDRDSMLNFLYNLTPEKTFFTLNSLAEDRQGRMWMSGKDGWIGYAETARPEAGLVRKINLRADFGLGEVFDLAVDPEGNIWGYTSEKMIRIDGKDLQISTFSFDYGIQDVDFYAFQFLPDGRLVFGGRDKILLLDVKTLKRNSELPKPYVEAVQVQGEPFAAVPLVNGRQGLHLKYGENYFTIAFSAKAFTLGQACRFRYRLSGLEDWTEAGDRRYGNYANVPGGDYHFQVQVANNEGVWNESIAELPVWVDTAWWATLWFRLLSVLAFMSMVYAIYRYRILQIRREERVRSGFEKRLANVEMSALLAQMNPHFLFNSLNSIDSYIIRNESKKASEYLNNFARLMRLILNNSRSNYISLKDELEALDLYLQMESLRFKDKFEYEMQVDPSIDLASITIPPMLIQPYIENAIWHGLMHRDQPGGRVVLQMSMVDNALVCSVEDNGVGRAKAMELSRNRTGKNRQSMGMQITEDRIEVLNKLYDSNTRVEIIDLYDAAGAPCGTRVVLTIPV